jgi:hypothetical protein
MSMRVTLDGHTPPRLPAPEPEPEGGKGDKGAKIRVTLPPPAPEPPTAKVMAFWFAEDRQPPPWRIESSEDRATREQAERDGAWAGL